MIRLWERFRAWRAKRWARKELRKLGLSDREIDWRLGLAQIRQNLRVNLGIETEHMSDHELADRIARFVLYTRHESDRLDDEDA